jgi:hypothetical protein
MRFHYTDSVPAHTWKLVHCNVEIIMPLNLLGLISLVYGSPFLAKNSFNEHAPLNDR